MKTHQLGTMIPQDNLSMSLLHCWICTFLEGKGSKSLISSTSLLHMVCMTSYQVTVLILRHNLYKTTILENRSKCRRDKVSRVYPLQKNMCQLDKASNQIEIP
jgi:hypothetical protein